MVLDAYADHEVTPSASVREETASFVDTGDDEWTILKAAFEWTGRPDDVVSSAQVHEFIKSRKLNLSPQKTVALIQKIGGKHSTNVVVNGKRTRGFTGIRMNNDDDDEGPSSSLPTASSS